jgi:L-iditol 2-dehydrogenase
MYYNNRDVRLEELPTPKAGPGELLVKVLASGICGSDVMEWYRIKKAPLVLGHEIAGIITEVGKGVKRYKAGDRVFVSHHVPCNACRYCLNDHHTACETLHTTNYFPGGFSEYVRVPPINVEHGVFILPPEVSFEEGTFIEPLACVVRGQRLAGIRKGQTVLILGGGISGLLHLLLARARGAEMIIVTDINQYRLKTAGALGAEAVIDARDDIIGRLLEVNSGRLADQVIVCTTALAAFTQALKSVDRGGTILFFASTDPGVSLPVPVDKFWRNEIKMLTSYGNSPGDATEAIRLIADKSVPVGRLITHKLNLKDTALGFRLVAEAGESIKVIIEPHKT